MSKYLQNTRTIFFGKSRLNNRTTPAIVWSLSDLSSVRVPETGAANLNAYRQMFLVCLVIGADMIYQIHYLTLGEY
jgi:hypothetical protein